jgi:hypothetical protein
MTASRVLHMIDEPVIREEAEVPLGGDAELEMRVRASGVDALALNAVEGLENCIGKFWPKKVKLPRQARSE